jgi:hypothetical protein
MFIVARKMIKVGTACRRVRRPPVRARADGSKHQRIRAVDRRPQPCTPRGATAILRFALDYEWIPWVSAKERMANSQGSLIGCMVMQLVCIIGYCRRDATIAT